MPDDDSLRLRKILAIANGLDHRLDRPVRDEEIAKVLQAIRRDAGKPGHDGWAHHTRALRLSHVPGPVFRDALIWLIEHRVIEKHTQLIGKRQATFYRERVEPPRRPPTEEEE